MITYGHEKFIEEAINGVLVQECDFEVELIIANDCSPDQTDVVIQNILENHPRASWIKYIKHNKNLGMMPNFIFTMEECKGEFVAMCEGDDYWTDPLKLQKQVDFLERNLDYAICFTKSDILFPEEGIKMGHLYNKPTTTYYEDIIFGNYITTLTVIFRRPINGFCFPDWYSKSLIGDWPLYLLLLKNGGKIHHLSDITGVYRLGNGVSEEFRSDIVKLKNIEAYILENTFNDFQFLNKKNITKKAFAKKILELATIDISKKKYFQSVKQLIKSLQYDLCFSTIKTYFHSIKCSFILK